MHCSQRYPPTNVDNVWYMDLGASNHMTCHGPWLKKMESTKTIGFVTIGDDTLHLIMHTSDVRMQQYSMFNPLSL